MGPEIRAAYEKATPTARKRLMATVLRDHEAFVRSMVAKFIRGHGSDAAAVRDDLHQAGRIGLIRAFEGWVPARATFMTFAYWKILHELQCALRDSRGIAIPRRSMISARLQQLRDDIQVREGREATAEDLGLSEACFKRWQQARVVFYAASTDQEWSAIAALAGDTPMIDVAPEIPDEDADPRRSHDDRFLTPKDADPDDYPQRLALAEYRRGLSPADRKLLDRRDPEAIAKARGALCR
jgi:DNA-directed RNA polymerase specialized sigma subunit